MTLNDLESDLYRRLGFQAVPDPVVTTRLRAYLNQTHRQILSQKGLHNLRQSIITATSLAGDPYMSIPGPAVRLISLVDRANRRLMQPVALSDIRQADPSNAEVTSIPHSYAVVSLATATTRPITVVGLSIKSNSASDGATITAHVGAVYPGAAYFVEPVVLNGTTAVNLPTPWPIGTTVSQFYIGLTAGGGQVAATGQITLYQGTGATGTPLATIFPGRTAAHAHGLGMVLQLYPVPQTAITYHADVERHMEEMSIGGDVPLLPEDFHWVLTSGALLMEWQRMEKTAQYDREKAIYREGLGDLKMFVARAAKADSKNGNWNGLHDSSFGPWYPVGGVGSAAPHAPTHEPGGTDPMRVDALPTIGSLRTLGSGPQQAAPGDDPRFSSAGGGPHHLTHESGGTDALSVVLLAGYPGGTTGFLRADATFATPAGGAGAHHTTHEPGGSDPMAVDALASIGSLRTLGTGAQQAAPGNDARFTAAPQLHAPTHTSGGTDAIKLDELAVPTDVLTLNATTSAHGLLRKLNGVATQFLDGTGAFSTPAAGVPSAHAATHQPGGGDPMAVDALASIGSLRTLGTGANQAAPGNDARFTTLAPHHTTHEPGGTDVLANNAWTNVANTFTQNQTIQSSLPRFNITDTNQAANQKTFDISNQVGLVKIRALDDVGAIVSTPLLMDRSGNATIGNNLTVNGSGGNVACKDQANTFTQNQTVSKADPRVAFLDSARPVDARVFDVYNGGGTLNFRALNDAATIQQAAPLYLTRAGDAVIGRDVYEKNRVTPMGHWVDVPFSAANFAASSATWSVASGNVLVNHYSVVGKTVIWVLAMTPAALSAATSVLYINVPFSTAATIFDGTMKPVCTEGGVNVDAKAYVANQFYIELVKTAGTTWSGSASVQMTFVYQCV